MKIKKIQILIALLVTFFSTNFISAQTFPPGFSQKLVAAPITGATTMALSPDGRFFIAQQNGILKVVKHDTLLNKPFITLNVNIDGERGLLGVALDPDFQSNHFIYLCYTIPSGLYNRVSRFTASGDTVVPGSEFIILTLDTLIANYHGGGHLQFGPDNKLYITAGENGRPAKSQDLNSYLGKILRINVDGSGPVDNPFPGPGKQQRVWAYGLRNPFTLNFQPGTGRLFVNDVGEVTWEEINEATTGGRNFGWPSAEGMSNNPNFTNPVYTYIHGTGDDKGCAITGGTFLNPDSGVSNYPASYLNKYYFIDYCGNWINSITLDSPAVWSHFATGIANYSVGILTGHDGNLYYISRNNEALYKVTYTTVASPIIVNQPLSQTISLNHPVTFSVTVSGAPPFTYQWRKGVTPLSGDTSSSLTIPAVAFSDSGNYNVVVTNSLGNTTSGNAHLTVTANQPPHATIDMPSTDTLYSAGEVINFHGSATDLESGTIPDSLFDWVIVFHHDTHVHPGPQGSHGVSSGSFTVPNIGEKATNVFYRIYLIVHDPQGAVDSSYIDIHPRTSTLTINTQPPGLTITLDGQPFVSPYTVLSVQGMIRIIGALNSQAYGNTTMYFSSWSNGGAITQSFPMPVNDTSFLATYDSLVQQFNIGNDTNVCAGDTITLDAGSQFTSYLWTTGSVNRFLNVHSAVADTVAVGVWVSDANGGVYNDSINIIFEICNSINEIENSPVTIYNSRSGGEIIIGEFPENYFLSVFDMSGKTIIQNESVNANRTKRIFLKPGIYSFLISTKDNRVMIHKKVVVPG